ncbi:hypothetical protein GF312_06205 [Candidatus Poribacteria bacterium]|nr:hypothetical protein [Candidatus Poribacteria bacterium]
MSSESDFNIENPYAIVDSHGVIEFFENRNAMGNIKLSIHGLDWAYRDQRNASINNIEENHEDYVKLFEGSLEVPASNDKFIKFSQRIIDVKDNGFDIRYEMTFPEAVSLNSYQVSLSFDLNPFKGQKILLKGDEDKEILIPVEYESMTLSRSMVKEVYFAPDDPGGFILCLNKLSSLLIQDNRRFGSDDVELRFNFHKPETGKPVSAGEEVERTFSFGYNQPLYVILDEEKEADRNDTEDWIPFTLPWNDAPLDFSFLNEKPAGKHGFLKVEGDKFVFEDGTPAKFWGTCFSASANFPSHEYSEILARRLAKFGVNIVRTHHADAGWSSPNFFEFKRDDPEKDNTLSFDPESMDRFDYMVYCLKQEGIYIYLDQLVHRKFKSGDGVDAVDELPNAAKPYSNFDPRLIELQKKFSHDLWNHVNPYTGLAYKDDPAIVLMEFANENDLFTQKVTLEPYRSRLEKRYRKWAMENDIQVSSEVVNFTEFTETIIRFLHEVQRDYYRDMHSYMREIDVKVPITGSNWSRNVALLSSLMILDYTDSHSYWDHPSGSSFHNRPMVKDPRNVFAFLSFNRTDHKPFFVSEWDQPWPNEWRAEHPLAMAAVASFQGWNGLAVYTYRHSTKTPIDYLSGSFETFNDPCRFGLFYHAALIFRRGDVKPADDVIAVEFSEEDVFKSPNPAVWNIPALPLLPEKQKLVMSIGDSDLPSIPYDKPALSDEDCEIHSHTGELYRNWEKGIGKIDTQMTKAAYGFLGDMDVIRMKGLKLEVKTDFATIALSSITHDKIDQSDKLLLTAVGRAENTGFTYNILHTKTLDKGTGPILIEPVEAEIEIDTDRKNLEVWALGTDGSRLKRMPNEYSNSKFKFSIGKEGKTIYYLIVESGGK